MLLPLYPRIVIDLGYFTYFVVLIRRLHYKNNTFGHPPSCICILISKRCNCKVLIKLPSRVISYVILKTNCALTVQELWQTSVPTPNFRPIYGKRNMNVTYSYFHSFSSFWDLNFLVVQQYQHAKKVFIS